MEIFIDVLFVILTVLITGVLAVLAALAFKAIKSLLKKMGIQISTEQENAIKNGVTQVVQWLNQTLVGKLKEANPDNKLTEEQIAEINKKAKAMIGTILTADQIELLMEKYGDMDLALDILIESTVDTNHATVYTALPIIANTDSTNDSVPAEQTEETVE